MIEEFLHLPSVLTTPVVHLELQISPRIFEKICNGPIGILRGLGQTDSWKKNQKSKISWHCPFKLLLRNYLELLVLKSSKDFFTVSKRKKQREILFSNLSNWAANICVTIPLSALNNNFPLNTVCEYRAVALWRSLVAPLVRAVRPAPSPSRPGSPALHPCKWWDGKLLFVVHPYILSSQIRKNCTFLKRW